MSQPEGGYHFCYLYILQSGQAWVCTPLFAIGLVLLVLSILQYRKNTQLNKMNLVIRLTYISMIASIVFYLLKLVLSEVVFWLEFYGQYDKNNDKMYLVASKYEFVLDMLGIFAMQTTILLVPVNWLKNICEIFKQFYKDLTTSEQEKQEIEAAIRFQECSIRVAVVYFVIRIVSLVGLIIPFIAIESSQSLSTVADVILIWWQIESLFLLVILILGLISLRQNKKLKQILQQSDFELMKKHYLMLIACTVLRLITDVMFTVYYFKFEQDMTECYAFGDKDKDVNIFGIVNIVLEGLLTLYVSVVLVLRIYKVDDTEIDDFDNIESSIEKAVSGDKKLKSEIQISFLPTSPQS